MFTTIKKCFGLFGGYSRLSRIRKSFNILLLIMEKDREFQEPFCYVCSKTYGLIPNLSTGFMKSYFINCCWTQESELSILRKRKLSWIHGGEVSYIYDNICVIIKGFLCSVQYIYDLLRPVSPVRAYSQLNKTIAKHCPGFRNFLMFLVLCANLWEFPSRCYYWFS